jgi:hypothetical protein
VRVVLIIVEPTALADSLAAWRKPMTGDTQDILMSETLIRVRLDAIGAPAFGAIAAAVTVLDLARGKTRAFAQSRGL